MASPCETGKEQNRRCLAPPKVRSAHPPTLHATSQKYDAWCVWGGGAQRCLIGRAGVLAAAKILNGTVGTVGKVYHSTSVPPQALAPLGEAGVTQNPRTGSPKTS